MADVLIKDMVMPTHCMDCPFMVSRDNDDCILQSAEANEGFENWEQMKDRCPLVPVPPHGRLIDENNFFSDDIIYPDKQFEKAMKDFVSDMPTVIEASEEKEK